LAVKAVFIRAIAFDFLGSSPRTLRKPQHCCRCSPMTLWQIHCGFYNLIKRMLSVLKSMQDVVYLQHIALVTASRTLRKMVIASGDWSGVSAFAVQAALIVRRDPQPRLLRLPHNVRSARARRARRRSKPSMLAEPSSYPYRLAPASRPVCRRHASD
jgi:hypothetical protein